MEKPLILIVDDEADVADTIAEMIGKTGRYETAVSRSGDEAIAKIRANRGFLGMGRNKIKLILLDIRMPGMSGLELVEKLHEEVDPKIDIIMVTAYDDDINWIDSVFTFGNVISFVRKPVDRDRLIALIDGYFKGEREELHKSAMAEFMRRDVGVKPEERL